MLVQRFGLTRTYMGFLDMEELRRILQIAKEDGSRHAAHALYLNYQTHNMRRMVAIANGRVPRGLSFSSEAEFIIDRIAERVGLNTPLEAGRTMLTWLLTKEVDGDIFSIEQQLHAIYYLLQNKHTAEVDLRARDDAGFTALQYALHHNWTGVVYMMLTFPDDRRVDKDCNGSLLLHAVQQRVLPTTNTMRWGRRRNLLHIVECTHIINRSPLQLHSPLMYAVLNNNESAIRALLRRPDLTNLNVREDMRDLDEHWNHILRGVAVMTPLEVMISVFQYHADQANDDASVILTPGMLALIQHPALDIGYTCWNGNNYLAHCLAQFRYHGRVVTNLFAMALLRYTTIDINTNNSAGRPPLTIALRHHNYPIANQLLLRRNIRVDVDMRQFGQLQGNFAFAVSTIFNKLVEQQEKVFREAHALLSTRFPPNVTTIIQNMVPDTTIVQDIAYDDEDVVNHMTGYHVYGDSNNT
jgi:hypothetical protein